MNFNIDYRGIKIDVCFDSKLNILTGNSGTGKTLLLSVLQGYCYKNSISYVHLDYAFAGKSEEVILSYIGEGNIVLLDNADLYVSGELLDKIASRSYLVIACIQNPYRLKYYSDCCLYTVFYNSKEVRVIME